MQQTLHDINTELLNILINTNIFISNNLLSKTQFMTLLIVLTHNIILCNQNLILFLFNFEFQHACLIKSFFL